MDGLIMAGQLILALSILVIIHELGHFLAARAFGIRVEKFYLFFDVGGFKLFKYKKGDVEYGIGWLPLGGYVKITGMIDESMDKDFAQSEPKPYEFRSKPAWQRLIVMLGGIIMNVVLGILIFTAHTFYYGEQYISADELKNGIKANKLAVEAGFQTGDVIVAINDKNVEYADQIVSTNLILDKNVKYTVLRNGEKKDIFLGDGFGNKVLNDGLKSFILLRDRFSVDSVVAGGNAEKAGLKKGDKIIAVNDTATLYFVDFTNQVAKVKGKQAKLQILRGADTLTKTADVSAEGTIGFQAKRNVTTVKYNFFESLPRGANKAWHAIADNAKGLWRLISGDLPPDKSLHGVIGIAHAFGGDWNWNAFWALTGMLSMVLAIMNLLPIPALDGGHVVFLLIEMLRGKPVSIKVLEVAQMVGMAILFLLMGYAFYNDFATFIFK